MSTKFYDELYKSMLIFVLCKGEKQAYWGTKNERI